jgi:hypothetical protein
MIRILVVVLALMASVQARAGEARLWIVEPSGPGNLSDCASHATREVSPPTAKARLLEADAEVRWAGGVFPLHGAGKTVESPERVWDSCFALVVDGRVVTAGAVLLPFSARLLRFPVLQILTRHPSKRLDFELNPGFPASLPLPVPQDWRDTFPTLR